MLSIGKLAGGDDAERYYTRAVAQGREDYYAGTGEAPGRWTGSAAAELETNGEVSESDLRALLQGADPVSGQPLRTAVSANAVAGFDLTFRAPKSVNIVWGVGDDATTRQIREAHDAAVDEALAYLEREACRTRRGRGGLRRIPGNGFIAAAFRHRTSRAGDPQLHTHVVVGNVTRGVDGRWSTLDGRLVFRHAKTAGYLYQAALRAQISERLGLQWTPVTKGTADLVGIPRELIEHFSRRRAEIVERMRERGEHSARAAQIAMLDTRRRKDYGVVVDRLREEWRARASELGFGRDELAQLLVRTEVFPPDRLELARQGADLGGPVGITREASTFDRRHVLQAWAERHRQGATVRRLEALSDRWLGSGVAVDLGPDPKETDERRFSTPEMLTTERRLLSTAAGRVGLGVGQADVDHVEAVLQRRATLSDEQADVVRRLTLAGHGVDVVRAAAGTGKTYVLDAAREAWDAGGLNVRGCALLARAAAELRDQAGIEASTIARLQLDLRSGYGLGEKTVLVVDEAGMVGTRDLAELAEHAEQAGAKLVLVGDDHQLPELQAGGAFRALAERSGAPQLREVRRQRERWDVEALARLRVGDVAGWREAYAEHGRIVGGRNAEETRSRLVDDWWSALGSRPGCDALMIAQRRADVAELNERARARLRSEGRLGPDELEAGQRAFSSGDRVLTARNDRRLGLANGQRGTVLGLDTDRRSLTIAFDAGHRVEVPSDYLDAGHLEHGYAMTAHRAQGATVDRAFVLGSDEMYREWGYTALTRHRDEARFYVNTGEPQEPLPGLEREDDPTLVDLERSLGRSHAREMALSARDGDDPPGRPLDEVIAEAGQLDAAFERVHQEAVAKRAAGEAEAQLDAARERLARSQAERDALRLWQRGRGAELDRRIAAQARAVEHWRAETERVAAEPERLAPDSAPVEPFTPIIPDIEPDLGPDVGL